MLGRKRTGSFSLVDLLMIVCVMAVLAFLLLPGPATVRADGVSADAYSTVPASVAVNDSVSVGTNSTLIIPNDSWAVGAVFCNDSTTSVYLAIGSPAVLHKGIYLAPGQCRVLPYPSTQPVYGIGYDTGAISVTSSNVTVGTNTTSVSVTNWVPSLSNVTFSWGRKQ